MKTQIKNLEGSKRELNVEVSGDVVKNKFEEVFKKIGQEAKVKGFRPGNAPRDILEKEFSGHAHDQVLKELIPEIYNQAVEQEKIDVVELPEISDVKLDRTTLSFKAVVDIAPEIKLKDYKGIKVEFKTIEVTQDEIKRYLDSIKESRKITAVDDDFARSLSYPNVAELEKALEKQIYIQKENAQRQKIEQEIVSAITKDADFKIPQSLINRRKEEMLRQARMDLAMKGIPQEKLDEYLKSTSGKVEEEAREQVKVYLILAEIAKKENIPSDDQAPQKVMELLLRSANWTQA
ncbi:MAG: trigger factor [Candidatus Omnitrophica bacterium]|nr:trigger factor [Candidatus Omnitrophota bacterium]